MALDRSLNYAPSFKKSRCFDFLDQPSSSAVVGSWKKLSRRSKRRWQIKLGDDELLAARLVMLARTGGGPYPSCPAAAAASPSTEESKHDGDNPVCPVTAAAASLDIKISQESVPTTPSLPPPVPKSYRSCVDCGKGFNSYQALGGHKASCRLKPTTTAAIDRKPCAVIPAVAVAAASTKCNPVIKPSGYKLHECEICHKSFTSGQALGGVIYPGKLNWGSKKKRGNRKIRAFNRRVEDDGVLAAKMHKIGISGGPYQPKPKSNSAAEVGPKPKPNTGWTAEDSSKCAGNKLYLNTCN